MSAITGTAAIGRCLDNISSSTVLRLIEDGLLKAYKLPGRGRTSPWRVERAELERFRERMRTDGLEMHMQAAE